MVLNYLFFRDLFTNNSRPMGNIASKAEEQNGLLPGDNGFGVFVMVYIPGLGSCVMLAGTSMVEPWSELPTTS